LDYGISANSFGAMISFPHWTDNWDGTNILGLDPMNDGSIITNVIKLNVHS